MSRAATAPAGPPRWLAHTATGLALGGLAVSAYLTVEHFSKNTTLACPNSGTFNCEQVTSSAQSMIFGIPVAVAGLAYFAGMLVLVAGPMWRIADPGAHRLVTVARLAGVIVGVLDVLYLVYAELFLINAICLWCTVVHVLTFALFAVVAFGTATAQR